MPYVWLFGLGTGSRQGLKGRYYVCAHVPVLPNQYLLCIIVRTYVRTAVGTWWLPLQSLLYSCVTIYSTYVRTHCSRYVVAVGTVAAVQLYSGTVAMASLYSYVPVHTA